MGPGMTWVALVYVAATSVVGAIMGSDVYDEKLLDGSSNVPPRWLLMAVWALLAPFFVVGAAAHAVVDQVVWAINWCLGRTYGQ